MAIYSICRFLSWQQKGHKWFMMATFAQLVFLLPEPPTKITASANFQPLIFWGLHIYQQKIYLYWLVVSNVFYVHSKFGEDSHFDEYIFQRGWNRQLAFFVYIMVLWPSKIRFFPSTRFFGKNTPPSLKALLHAECLAGMLDEPVLQLGLLRLESLGRFGDWFRWYLVLGNLKLVYSVGDFTTIY